MSSIFSNITIDKDKNTSNSKKMKNLKDIKRSKNLKQTKKEKQKIIETYK